MAMYLKKPPPAPFASNTSHAAPTVHDPGTAFATPTMQRVDAASETGDCRPLLIAGVVSACQCLVPGVPIASRMCPIVMQCHAACLPPPPPQSGIRCD